MSESIQQFDTGAIRGTDANDTRYDLISEVGLRRLAETYAEGAKKYAPNNWRRGLPIGDTLNHVLKHLNQWKGGDSSEDHLAHAAWGLFAIMEFEETKPELMDVFARMPKP